MGKVNAFNLIRPMFEKHGVVDLLQTVRIESDMIVDHLGMNKCDGVWVMKVNPTGWTVLSDENRDQFFKAVLQVVAQVMPDEPRALIDAQFADMANDSQYQADAERIAEEFTGSEDPE